MERNHIGIGREPPRLSVTLPLSFRGAFGEQIFPGDDGMPNSRLRLSMRRRRSKRGGLAPVMTASGRRDVICIEIRFVFLPPPLAFLISRRSDCEASVSRRSHLDARVDFSIPRRTLYRRLFILWKPTQIFQPGRILLGGGQRRGWHGARSKLDLFDDVCFV